MTRTNRQIQHANDTVRTSREESKRERQDRVKQGRKNKQDTLRVFTGNNSSSY